MDDKNKDTESKVTNDNKWIHPKKFVPFASFFKTCKNKEELEENNNEHNMLVDNYKNDKEEQDEMKENKIKLKRMKEKVNKNNKSR